MRYRVLPADEAAGLDVLRRGEEFQTLCQVLAEQGDPEDAALRAAGFLKHWLDAGWITDLSAEGMSWS